MLFFISVQFHLKKKQGISDDGILTWNLRWDRVVAAALSISCSLRNYFLIKGKPD